MICFYRLAMMKNRKPILDVLQREKPNRVPFWLMRQAGRYLPEYLDLRGEAGSFLNLVYDSEKAAEVTVQPLRRFGMDAAILFSDILIVPHALGQGLRFETGEGPVLDPIRSSADINKLDLGRLESNAAPVYETVSRVRQKLASENFDETALIGFCGAPWTVICYMVEGRGGGTFAAAMDWMRRDPEGFSALTEIVIQASCLYLAGQIKAGAEVIQLFESWGGLLEGAEFDRWVIEPTGKIRKYLADNFPHIPVIGFPRGAGTDDLAVYAVRTNVDCVGLGQDVDRDWAAKNIQRLLPVQGNLAPETLLAGGDALEREMEQIRVSFGDAPFIFNLGHGIIKETPIAHVTRLSEIVKGWNIV